jgi:hypothetical protein
MTLLPVERLTSSDPTLLVQAAKTAGDPFGDLMRALFHVPVSAGTAFDQLFANATSRTDSPAAVQAPAPPRADHRPGRVATSASTDPPPAAAGSTPDRSADDKTAPDKSGNDKSGNDKTSAAGETAATRSNDGTATTSDSDDTGSAKDAASETASADGTQKPSKSETKEGGDDPTARSLALQGFAQALVNPNSPVATAVLAALAGNGAAAPGAIAEVATAAAGGVARGLSKAGGPASGPGGQAAGAPKAGAAGAQQTASQDAFQANSQTASAAPGAAAKIPTGAAIQATVVPPDGTAFVSRPSSTLSGSSTLVFGLDDAKAGAAAATKPTDGTAPNQASADGGAAKAAQTPAGMPAAALVSSIQANASGAGNKFAAQPGQPAATVPDAPGPQAGTVQPIATAAGLGTDARAGAAAQTQSANLPRAAAPLPPADQVAVQITKAVGDGLDRITMQLRPEHLGRIDVQLDVGSDGRVSAVIAAHRPDTLNLLQRDASALARALQDAGLHADAGSLSFNLGGQNSGGSASFATADASPAPTLPDVPFVEPAPVAVPLSASNAAATGGVDIRV